MSEHTDYGTRLKRLRRERGLTAAELAAAVNALAGGVVTSRDAVTRAENHIRRRVPLAEAVLAAHVLRVGSERLLFVGDDPRAESPFFEYRGMSNRRARAAWRGGDGGRPVRVGGRMRSAHANHDVVRVDPDNHEILARYRSVEDAVRWLRGHGAPRASHANVSDACRGKRRSAYGYAWRYWAERTRRVDVGGGGGVQPG